MLQWSRSSSLEILFVYLCHATRHFPEFYGPQFMKGTRDRIVWQRESERQGEASMGLDFLLTLASQFFQFSLIMSGDICQLTPAGESYAFSTEYFEKLVPTQPMICRCGYCFYIFMGCKLGRHLTAESTFWPTLRIEQRDHFIPVFDEDLIDPVGHWGRYHWSTLRGNKSLLY